MEPDRGLAMHEARACITTRVDCAWGRSRGETLAPVLIVGDWILLIVSGACSAAVWYRGMFGCSGETLLNQCV